MAHIIAAHHEDDFLGDVGRMIGNALEIFRDANDAKPGDWSAERAAAVRAFGPPAQVLYPAGYTVLVWHQNLLAGLR